MTTTRDPAPETARPVPGAAPAPPIDFADLYRQWWPVLMARALARLPCAADAEGVAQRIFARLWDRGLAHWTSISSLGDYFEAAVKNEALLLERGRRRLVTLDHGGAASRSREPGPDEIAAYKELCSLLRRLIADLPPRCGAVMSLIGFEDLTHREVAARLGIGVKAVEKQVTRGRRLLREMAAARLNGADRDVVSIFLDGGDEPLMHPIGCNAPDSAWPSAGSGRGTFRSSGVR